MTYCIVGDLQVKTRPQNLVWRDIVVWYQSSKVLPMKITKQIEFVKYMKATPSAVQ